MTLLGKEITCPLRVVPFLILAGAPDEPHVRYRADVELVGEILYLRSG
jgi:hypothetical protein